MFVTSTLEIDAGSANQIQSQDCVFKQDSFQGTQRTEV